MQAIGLYLVSNFSGFNFTKLLHLLSPLLQTPAVPSDGWSTDSALTYLYCPLKSATFCSWKVNVKIPCEIFSGKSLHQTALKTKLFLLLAKTSVHLAFSEGVGVSAIESEGLDSVFHFYTNFLMHCGVTIFHPGLWVTFLPINILKCLMCCCDRS